MSKEPTTNSQGLSEECHAMISRISHEVRNPVAVIHSFHQLLLLAHPELSNDLYFQKIQENMAFLNSLLDELSCYNHSYRAVRAYVNPYLLLQNLCADTGVLLEKHRFPLFKFIPHFLSYHKFHAVCVIITQKLAENIRLVVLATQTDNQYGSCIGMQNHVAENFLGILVVITQLRTAIVVRKSHDGVHAFTVGSRRNASASSADDAIYTTRR